MDTIVGLYADQPFWFWAALAAALLATEVVIGAGWLLWASASAGVTAVVTAIFDASIPTALLVFALLTLFSSVLARRYLPKPLAPEGVDINDNIARLVGHRGSVVQPFAGRTGRVFIDGKEWSAEVDDGGPLEAGVAVEVTGVTGARLRVRRT